MEHRNEINRSAVRNNEDPNKVVPLKADLRKQVARKMETPPEAEALLDHHHADLDPRVDPDLLNRDRVTNFFY